MILQMVTAGRMEGRDGGGVLPTSLPTGKEGEERERK